MLILTEHSSNRFLLLHNLKTNPSSTVWKTRHIRTVTSNLPLSPCNGAGKFSLGFLSSKDGGGSQRRSQGHTDTVLGLKALKAVVGRQTCTCNKAR